MTYQISETKNTCQLNSLSSSIRLFYAAGPGNVLGTYEYWVKGQDDPSQVSVTYSGQFYELCRDLNAEGYIISYNQEKAFIKDGRFTIEHRPKSFRQLPGFLYHFSEIWYGIQLIKTALIWKADVVIISEGTTHWFLLTLLSLLGIHVIPVLHCTLWRQYIPPKGSDQFFLRLSKSLFTRCTAILSASDDITDQVKQLTRKNHNKIVEFLPLYRRSEFRDIKESEPQNLPFRIMFMGRIEIDKGVFDLLEIARRFAEGGFDDIRFDICGNGSQIEALRRSVKELGLEQSFVCHGYCKKNQLHEILSQSHVVIAPTTTDFIEGFCQAAAEGVLAGRPVITSAVCPALSYIRPAVVEVQPNDIKGYGDAILKLLKDQEFYEGKRQSCNSVQEQFYDTSKSWLAALKSILMSLAFKGIKTT